VSKRKICRASENARSDIFLKYWLRWTWRRTWRRILLE